MEEITETDNWYTLPGFICVGARVRAFYNAGNPNNELRHIRAIVDGDQIVYRVWRRGRWRYYVDWGYRFYLEWKDGHLKPA